CYTLRKVSTETFGYIVERHYLCVVNTNMFNNNYTICSDSLGLQLSKSEITDITDFLVDIEKSFVSLIQKETSESDEINSRTIDQWLTIRMLIDRFGNIQNQFLKEE
ncbi:MAG: hypothetical protein Q4D14_05220, partial [Bacteroidales bacterium]|nr:hypothetical protein [Bacteroidales bacterium]